MSVSALLKSQEKSMSQSFNALVVTQTEPKQFSREIVQRNVDDLPAGEVLVRVNFSSLNFKDALSATGNPGVTRNFPHTPGIDAVGVVESSEDEAFKVGDQVIVTSYDLGMNTAGGLGQYIRVPAAWVVPLPVGLTMQQSMSYGTAGLTASMMVNALIEQGVEVDDGEVLVTGATGGVGSVAVAILARLGYRVCAVTGKPEQASYLQDLGAESVISREELTENKRPMLKERWAGVIDVVGGEILASAIKATKYTGTVTCSGMVGDISFTTSIFPFILRGVKLIGIDSVECDMRTRLAVWQKMASVFKPHELDQLTTEIKLEQVETQLMAMLAGKSHGRFIVDMS